MGADPIHVDYEYGDLKEVIVGRADMRYPDLGRADWVAEALRVLPGGPHRRAEQLGYRRLYAERLPGSGARWFQMPLQDVSATVSPGYSKEGRPTLEGGDLLVLGGTILAGTTVNPTVGSSALGVEWLRPGAMRSGCWPRPRSASAASAG